MASIIIEDQIEIPFDVRTLADFQRWALSDSFPDSGRIDYVLGNIEVDMSPEEFFCHGTLKTELIRVISDQVKHENLGHLVSDRTRISLTVADTSVEPDIVFISHDTLESGRAQLVPKATGEFGRFVAVEGPADLVVEIVSDSSVVKDTQRLLEAYYKGGIREYWLADARKDDLYFQIFHPGDNDYAPAPLGDEGFQFSAVLDHWFRLRGNIEPESGYWQFDLDHHPA